MNLSVRWMPCLEENADRNDVACEGYGADCLYVTHDQVEAMSMSDEIVVMRKGEVLRVEPEMIYETPSHPFVASFIGKSNWLTVDHSMVRPEHVTWSRTSTEDVCYQATVLSVSYVGERYEIRLQVEAWTSGPLTWTRGCLSENA